jgi:anti-sigma factor RsiW
MLCEHANPYLIEYAEGELPSGRHTEVEAHLSGCAKCQADYDAIIQFRTMASNWHDEVVPAWKPAPIPGHDWFESFRLWFPTAASTAALAMATLIFIQLPETSGVLPTNQTMPTNYEALPPLPQATQAAMVQSVMDGSRQQRQAELQALLKILKAEMDKRSIETEESLRFVISSQLQGQQELDDLYNQVEDIMLNPDQATATPVSKSGVVKP